MESWRELDVEEAVVDVVAVAFDPEPNPKRPVGLKEPFEFFEEALSLVTGAGLDVEVTGLTATGIWVGFVGSAVPVPFQTLFTRFLAEERKPNLEVVPLFSKELVRTYPPTGTRDILFALAREGRPTLFRGPTPLTRLLLRLASALFLTASISFRFFLSPSSFRASSENSGAGAGSARWILGQIGRAHV